MARVLALVARREHELRGPRVTELVAVAHEHVEDRDLLALHCLGVVVAVVTVFLRGEKPQVSPGALPGEGADPLGIRLRDHREVGSRPTRRENGCHGLPAVTCSLVSRKPSHGPSRSSDAVEGALPPRCERLPDHAHRTRHAT